jgi:dynein heavy chain 1
MSSKPSMTQKQIESHPGLGKVKEYVKKAAQTFLSVPDDVFDAQINKPDQLAHLCIFLADTSSGYLVISYNPEPTKDEPKMVLGTALDPLDREAGSAIVLFKSSEIDMDSVGTKGYLKSRFNLLNLGTLGASTRPNLKVFNVFHECVKNGFIPMFNSLKGSLQAKEEKQESAQKAQLDPAFINAIYKKFTDLEMTIQQKVRNSEVPKIELAFNKELSEICRQAAERGEFPKLEDVPERLLNDREFINNLGEDFNRWPQQISALENFGNDNVINSINGEINYWISMYDNLQDVCNQLRKPEVQLTVEILKHKRRYTGISNLEVSLGLQEKLKSIDRVTKIMRNLPYNQIMLPRDYNEITNEIIALFTNVRKLADVQIYSQTRIKNFLEMLNKEFYEKIIGIAKELKFMKMDYEKLKDEVKKLSHLTKVKWDSELKETIDMINRARKATLSKHINVLEINNKFENRVKFIRDLKTSHENLRLIYKQVYEKDPHMNETLYKIQFPTIKDIDNEFEIFANIDPFDLTSEGSKAIEDAYKRYHSGIAEIDRKVVSLVQNLFSKARNNNDKFKIFSKFFQLFQKPEIKQELKSYQDELLKIIENDVQALIDKYKAKADKVATSAFTVKFKITPNIYTMMWTEQVVNSIKMIVNKLTFILGEKWEETTQGKEISLKYVNFSKLVKTNVDEILTVTEKSYEQKKDEEIFSVRKTFDGSASELHVNINEENRKLIKGMRFVLLFNPNVKTRYYMKYLFKKTSWPSYVSGYMLKEAVRIFNSISQKLSPVFTKMLSRLLKSLYLKIENSYTMKWYQEEPTEEVNITKIEKLAINLLSTVNQLEETYEWLNQKNQLIEAEFKSLEQSDSNVEKIIERIKRIQMILNDFETQELKNINSFIQTLNDRIEALLLNKLKEVIASWTIEFLSFSTETLRDALKQNKLIQDLTQHEVKVENQLVFLDPPIEYSRQFWLAHLQSNISALCSVQKLRRKGRFDKVAAQQITPESFKQDSFGNLAYKLPENILTEAYNWINTYVKDGLAYIGKWKAYQSLWDMDIKKINESLGEDFDSWQQVLNEIKSGKKAFNYATNDVNFGPIVINFKYAQRKINSKYNALHREILNEFAKMVGSMINTFYEEITAERKKLEEIDLNDSEKIITAISQLRNCRNNIDRWETTLKKLKAGESLLSEQKYSYPLNWKEVSWVEGEWQRMLQNYELRDSQYRAESNTIKGRLLKEEDTLVKKVQEIEGTWKSKKPFSGNLHPKEAIEVIESLEKTIHDNKISFDKLNQAKELLGLPQIDLSNINTIIDDSISLKELWGEIQKHWDQIDKIMDTQLKVANPNKYQTQYDEIYEALNSLPNKFRTYEALVVKKNEIQNLKKTNRLLKELKTDAVKEHHWDEMLKKIKLNKKYKNVTVGDLHKQNILVHEKALMEIVGLAQGELVLETMLKKIKDFWNNEEFQMSKYQDKCMLIKGWDDLMTKIEDDLSQLNSMKLSQHFKIFEDEIKSWNEKLVNMQGCLDVWVNVQRKWVYLEGIFLGSSDISQQLPNEYAKFKSIDNDFTSLMKKTASKLKILDVISNIPNLQKSLQILYDSLEKIQKALSEYLETQRQAFARFYFVGDEDLLEIIGNSKEVTNIQKYFSKMFAGINFIENEDNGVTLKGMRSRENEDVAFKTPFKISTKPRINEWLTEVEVQMQRSLALETEGCIQNWNKLSGNNIRELTEKYPAQAVLLSFQIYWTFLVEEGQLGPVVDKLVSILDFMAEEVLTDLQKLTRSKYEQLITEFVHKRDVTRALGRISGFTPQLFDWVSQMRFYQDMLSKGDPEHRVKVRMGNSEFFYGFEYLGICEKLVQTPLTDKCYFTLTQALWLRMGGAPFGPAGTGKTESVKALGNTLGRFVLVFNCDETFNTKAMGRIFIGLCQVGAWGCFDEFNRLEEKILSAVSQDILTIQTGLREKAAKIDLMSRSVKLNTNMGIFVTMNPGYAGRSNLPENLKQLFRQMAMIKPDRELIAQVMLFSQGFKSAEALSSKVVALFELCADQLSSQPHYDFGLRALKSVLNSAGGLKRRAIKENKDLANQPQEEQKIILRSFCDTVVPKLVSEDTPLLETLIKGVFPSAEVPKIDDINLRKALNVECQQRNLLETDIFIEKVLQLNQIMKLQHGIMLVGPTGCGKTMAWRCLLSALSAVDGIKGESYIIDPKAINKEELYGKLDNTTLEWTDGIFTYTLRKILENARGESSKRHWIIFDGDVDPEWAENLNSVLDDNKLLTLPNGDRLSIPNGVKIMFEVESLKYATLATVSRCGMVWFSDDVLHPYDIFYNYLMRLKVDNYDQEFNKATPNNAFREKAVKEIEPFFYSRTIEQVFDKGKVRLEKNAGFVFQALELAKDKEHVMEFSIIRHLEALFALIRKGVNRIVEYNEHNPDFPLDDSIMSKFIKKWTIQSMLWSFVGDLKLAKRADYYNDLINNFGSTIRSMVDLPTTGENLTLIDYGADLKTGEWILWKDKVPDVDVEESQVTAADLIIPTVDTLRHQEVLCSWLLEKRPFIICGPPGSGKTMTLMSTLKNLTNFEMVFVNFSASTTPGLIIKQFEHYCEAVKSTSGITLRPRQINKNLVVFCDEINLPDEDKYGTQYVITFLRQLTEQHGYWRNSDKQWVSLERIQFVGACNPPTDAGRHPLSPRFLRHCPLILVDFPGYYSLTQIYGTFNKGMLKKVPSLKAEWQNLTRAMVEYYTQSQKRFTADIQSHYIYSPRELTRWKYAINQALDGVEDISGLVRLWAHEALRLFEDRLVTEEEKEWCQQAIDRIAKENFKNFDSKALQRPILYSMYLTKTYSSVSLEDLRSYIIAKLRVFNEEKYSIQLVVFDSVLDHIIRIDRVLRQPIGHLLLVGSSGVGKTTLSRFVSWMNGLDVFQIKAGRNYGLADFDANLREVMKRSGCKMEKICFIFDESNVLGVAFLERMNALLASGEVPGLFEGEEYAQLIHQYKEHNPKDKNKNDEEIYANFTKFVQRNLHVVFTMNPANPDFSNRTASSPAIFNRCVIDWFGDWNEDALYQVARELTDKIEIPPNSLENNDLNSKDVLVTLVVKIHNCVKALNSQLKKGAKKFNYLTPRDFLDFIKHLKELHKEKNEILLEQQHHLSSGLSKLKETEEKVSELDASLNKYKIELDRKQKEANIKMNQMIEKQKEAESEKEKMKAANDALTIKKKEIEERKVVVTNELSEAEPALIAAKEAVGKISPKEINDIRVLNNPPEPIKTTMTAVVMLTEGLSNMPSWKEIQAVMKKADFTNTIKTLDIDRVPDAPKKYIMREIMPKFEMDKIKRAYQAAWFMAEWVSAQLKFSDILKKVDPLRNQIKELETGLETLISDQNILSKNLQQIEKNIQDYKIEYESLTAQIQKTKNDMAEVNAKVEKSKQLLGNLSSEKVRWTETSQNYANLIASMTGDVLISAAFLAYCGFFDQLYRGLLLKTWKQFLTEHKLKYKDDLSITEFLSTAAERMTWAMNKLPSDDLCSQNAIILKRHNRYPLIIDPSGQASEFILNFYREKKIEKTSFDEVSFLKTLEKSLRFGLPVLIENVEKIEPMLNSVLNREVIKQAGRVLVRVGDQEIDFHSSFLLFMITRNSDAKFTPDLCSRVTFINFTVTQSSLENQCINMYLHNERPEVEKKRIELLKLQGEYLVKIRELEDDLLTKISEQTGNILDNVPLLKTLDTLKIKANEIMEKMKESDKVLKEVNDVTAEYGNLAHLSAKIYFTLLSFSQINIIYQYSFQFYMKILLNLISTNEKLAEIPKNEYQKRIDTILEQLFVKVYQKLQPSLLEKDKILISFRFAQLKLGTQYAEEFKSFFEPNTVIEEKWSGILEGKLEKQQILALESLGRRRGCDGLGNSLRSDSNRWLRFIRDEEKEPPMEWYAESNPIKKDIIRLTVFKILKPGRCFEQIYAFLSKHLGEEFVRMSVTDLKTIMVEDSDARSPVFLSSAPGFDPSFQIDDVAKKLNKKYEAIAIGSTEGYDLSLKAMDRAAKAGTWVVLKNVHLACSWLGDKVESHFGKLKQTPEFRLFLVSEFNDKLPPTLLRQSVKVNFELPDGIRANVLRSLTSLFVEEKFNTPPVERGRIYFQTTWLHAVIMERIRYTPIGWSKAYEFSEADLRCSVEIIDQLLEKPGAPADHLIALRSIVCNNIYGGKIDNEFDLKILKSLVDQFISAEFFKPNHYFVKDGDKVILPNFEAKTYKDYLDWIQNLKEQETPVWAGLPVTAEEVLKRNKLDALSKKLLMIQDVNEEEIESIKDDEETGQSTQLKWLKTLSERSKIYNNLLPKEIKLLVRNEKLITNPLFRFLEREVTVCHNLLKRVKKNLKELEDMAEGRLQPLQELKNMAKTIFAGEVPKTWKKYTLPEVNVSTWVQDFKNRLDQVTFMTKTEDWQRKGVNLGLMLFPEAFLTSSRQFVAQNNKLSLDELELRMSLTNDSVVDENSFLAKGLHIEGVNWTASGLRAERNISFELGPVKFTWTKTSNIKLLKPGEILIPIYLNNLRKNLLTSIKFDISNVGLSEQVLYQKGLAIILWHE